MQNKSFSNLPDKREKHNLRFQLGQLVRTADIEKVSSKGVSTKWSYKLNTTTEVIHDTLHSYQINYLPERCNENLLRPTFLTLKESNPVMKKPNPIE